VSSISQWKLGKMLRRKIAAAGNRQGLAKKRFGWLLVLFHVINLRAPAAQNELLGHALFKHNANLK